ncbi:MAG: hypothetical protein WCQ82_01550 [Bacteroidaceae bacterium]|nr:hypothetical protein [Bacteroidaceae bacterium]
MIEEKNAVLTIFKSKIEQLKDHCDRLAEENEKLKRLIQEKDADLASFQQKYDRLQMSYSHLKDVKILTLRDGDIKQTKRKISDIVRNIDKCISLLNK